MANYQRLQLASSGSGPSEVTLVRLVDRTIIGDEVILGLQTELFQLVDNDGHLRLVINFAIVELLSSETLSTLLMLHDKLQARGGNMRLCSIRPELYEVFKITRLNQKFVIKVTEAEALQDF